MSDYEAHNFPTAADALAEIRRQYLAGEPLHWTGPDRLHHAISAGCPPPSELFTPEGLAHDADQGRDFWDVYTMVAFQLGYHNGTVRQEKETDFYRDTVQFWKDLAAERKEQS